MDDTIRWLISLFYRVKATVNDNQSTISTSKTGCVKGTLVTKTSRRPAWWKNIHKVIRWTQKNENHAKLTSGFKAMKGT